MRKLWVILLSLGLIMAFAMPAAAVDVKFSGSYYAQGFYVDNVAGLDKNAPSSENSWANNSKRSADAWYGQQLRTTIEFQVVEGLKLVTRFDALEKRWGDQGWAGGTGETQSRLQTVGTADNAAPRNQVKAQENIEWERAYLDFNVPFGKFQVGYMQFLMWGTDFLNTPLSAGGIRYFYSQGPWQAVAAIEKRGEWVSTTQGNLGVGNDADKDVYDLGVTYKFKPGEVGVLWQYNRNSQQKTEKNNGYITQVHGIFPYAKLTFGNIFVEGEAVYGFGDLRSYENNGAVTNSGPAKVGNLSQNVGVSAMGLFLHGKYNWSPAYVGLQFVYLSGDDNQNSDKITGGLAGILRANYGFNRALILWNADYGDNLGAFQGNVPAAAAGGVNQRTGMTYAVNQFMDNVWFYQIYAGVKPTPKMDIKLALSYANADKKPKSDVGAVGSAGYYTGAAVKEFVSDKYGTELDLTGSYKIYDNLTYMIGVGYLWTGDYFKGYDDVTTLKDNYMITHRLTLNF